MTLSCRPIVRGPSGESGLLRALLRRAPRGINRSEESSRSSSRRPIARHYSVSPWAQPKLDALATEFSILGRAASVSPLAMAQDSFEDVVVKTYFIDFPPRHAMLMGELHPIALSNANSQPTTLRAQNARLRGNPPSMSISKTVAAAGWGRLSRRWPDALNGLLTRFK